MGTDTAATSGRPRPWLVIALGVVLALYLVLTFWPSSKPPATAAAPPPRAAAKAAANGGEVTAEDLKVNLQALKEARPDPGAVERNPFRFQPVAPPPPAAKPPVPPVDTTPQPPPGPPPPPPIPLKFIGIVEGVAVGKVAAFSDCKRTFYGREGDIVDGRYKLLKIGVESVTMSYPDGRGQQTIRLSGQECIGK